jgi:hypothetical protein
MCTFPGGSLALTAVVTILSGTVRLRHGETADPDQAEYPRPCTLLAMPPGLAHVIHADDKVIVQLTSGARSGSPMSRQLTIR